MKRLGKTIAQNVTLANTLVNDRGGRVMNDRGEIEASSVADALKQIASVCASLSAGNKVLTASEAEDLEKARKNRKETLAAMIADKSGETTRKVGETLAGTINTSLARLGFMRQLMTYQTLEQGQRPEIYVQDKNVTAAVMTGPTQAQLQFVRDPYIILPEVDLVARLYISGRDINVSREDILQRKFDEGLEQIVVKEDTMFKTAVDTLAAATGQVSLHASANVTPAVFESGMTMITNYNMAPGAILFATNLYNNFITNRDFENLIEPVTRLELLRTGQIGSWYGWAVMTDGVREPSQKVLDAGDIYYFSTPDYVGEYTDRGGVQSTPLTVAETGVNGAGWHISEYMSQGVPNHRAIARTRMI